MAARRLVMARPASYLSNITQIFTQPRWDVAHVDDLARDRAPSAVSCEGFQLNKANHAATPTAPKPRDRVEVTDRPDKNLKRYPCLLTRAELKAIIAEQLG
jgi:hypothetical protein